MPPREVPCRSCGSLIVLAREVDSGRHLVLNARQAQGGTVVMLGGRGHIIPGGGNALAYTLHACERGRA